MTLKWMNRMMNFSRNKKNKIGKMSEPLFPICPTFFFLKQLRRPGLAPAHPCIHHCHHTGPRICFTFVVSNTKAHTDKMRLFVPDSYFISPFQQHPMSSHLPTLKLSYSSQEDQNIPKLSSLRYVFQIAACIPNCSSGDGHHITTLTHS